MAADDTPLITARRNRLKAWIDERHEGRQVDFIARTGINQGELSGLLRGHKSFGEKKARTIERDAGMPKGYLVSPLPSEARIPGDERPLGLAINRIENDLDALNFALGSVLAVMVRHRPAEAEALAAELQKVPAKFRDSGLIGDLKALLRAGKRPARARSAS